MIVKIKSDSLSPKSLDRLQEIKRWGNHLKVITHLEVQYTDFENINETIKGFEIVSIDWRDLKKLNEESLVDLMLKLSTISIDIELTQVPKHSLYKLREMVRKLNVTNVKFSKDYKEPPNINELDVIDVNIIGELFEINSNSKYNLIDSLVTCEIYKCGTIEVENNYVGHCLLSEPILEDVIKIENKIKLNLVQAYLNYPFNLNTYLSVLNANEGKVGDLLDYKWEVFKLIQGITLEEMAILPNEVVSFCNKNEYIPYKDILEVTSGNYRFAKYFGGDL